MTVALDEPTKRARDEVPCAASRSVGRHDRWWVVLLTAVAGISRLLTAGSPALWNDEAHTFRRVCGTFAELSAMLRESAFPPLHYYVYWLLGRALGGPQQLTPFWMRFVPAVAGTLMVPAMWRLARQFCDRRAALLVAAFSACSAFLFSHAHDAKMYMPLWALVAINFSWWLSWLREGRAKHGVLWIASGIVMVGYHASGTVMLLVELASLGAIEWPGRRRMAIIAVGFMVIAAGPISYYTWGNDFVSHSRDVGWHTASGLGWLRDYDQSESNTPNPLLKLATIYLLGWGWPGAVPSTAGDSRLRMTLITASCLLLLFAVAGAGLWIARRVRSGSQEQGRESFASVFVLGFWLIVPVYVAYQLSKPLESRPGDSVVAAMVLFAGAWAVILKLAWRPTRAWIASRGVSDSIAGVVGAGCLIGLITGAAGAVALAAAGSTGESSSVWVPRYLAFVWPALAIVVCAAVWALNPPLLRWAAVALLIGINVAQSAALVLADSEPPVDRIVSDVYGAGQSAGKVRAYIFGDVPGSPGCAGGTLQNSVGRYYLSIASGNRFGPGGFSETALADFTDVRLWSQPAEIVDDLKQGGLPDRVIVWDYIPPRGEPALGGLGAEWNVAGDERIAVRCRWDWGTLYSFRRTEYVRHPPQERP